MKQTNEITDPKWEDIRDRDKEIQRLKSELALRSHLLRQVTYSRGWWVEGFEQQLVKAAAVKY